MFCPSCGKIMPDEAKFCMSCGCNLEMFRNQISSGSTNFQYQKPNIIQPGTSSRKYNLRKSPLKRLSVTEIENMINKYGFYCGGVGVGSGLICRNSGITHDYKMRKNGKVVFDGATGLYWLSIDNEEVLPQNEFFLRSRYGLDEAQEYINKININFYADYNDWRIPTLEEAMSLMQPSSDDYEFYIDPLFKKKTKIILTSDLFDSYDVWLINYHQGDCFTGHFGEVMAVRGVGTV